MTMQAHHAPAQHAASPDGEVVLEVAGATRRFGGLVAVDHVSFEIRRGEILGLIGPNGSGKTTLLNLVSGALRPSDGRISLLGEDISGLAANRINRLGIARTFQLVRVLPSLTCLDNCMAGMMFGRRRLWGRAARHAAMELLEEVGLGGKAEMHPGALTYIDQKRLELARALASKPQLLLLDEWLAGLNPGELPAGMALIEKLNAAGATIILVEHVMDAVRSLCNRCVVMAAGRKIAEGSPEAVLSDAEVIRVYIGDDA